MPIWVVLFAVAIVLICASYYLPMPPEIKAFCRFGGIVSALFAVLILLYDLFVAGTLRT